MFPGFEHFNEGQIIAFALIFLRNISFVIAWPIFGVPTVPVHLKVLLAIVFSVLLFPIIKFQNIDLLKIDDHIIFLSFREIVVGLFLGFLLRFFFFAISIAGEMIGVSSGLASAQIFNPSMGVHSNVMEQFHLMLATLFVLALNGHYLFIQGLAQSFEMVPISSLALKSNSFSSVSLLVKDAFFMGIKMAAPVVVSIFATNMTMGLLGRTVPQLNVMMTSFQFTILISVVVILFMMPIMIEQMDGLLRMMADKFFQTMRVL